MIEALLALFDYVRNGSISNIGIIILIILSFVQIAPVKFNPYDQFFAWLRNKLMADTHERLNSLWVNFYRQHILRFARECRQDVKHTEDEWHYVLTMASEYEAYCRDNHVANGVIDAETHYIRNLFQEISHERKFA